MRHCEFTKDAIVLNNNYMQNTPEVSIVMPTYCRLAEGLLQKCIDSVLGQTYTNFEFIIIDDGSVDGSKDLIERYAKRDKRIVYIRHEQNSGLPAVRTNEGILMARGNYIAFVFDDNVWDKEYLLTLVSEMEKNPADVQYSITHMHMNDCEYFNLGDWPLTEEFLFHLNTVPNGSVLCTKSFFEKYGVYDPHICIRRICDWDLWLRAKVLGAKFNFVNKALSHEYGPSSEVSLGLTVKMDYKLSYAYMSDIKEIRNRTQKLLPKNIDDYDVFDRNAILPYIKNYEELRKIDAIVYEPFLSAHREYYCPNNFHNKLFGTSNANSISPFINDDLSADGKRRFLFVCNTYNDKLHTLINRMKEMYNNSIILSCGEWQFTAYDPTEIDAVFLVDCTALFIYDYLTIYKKLNKPIIYIIQYGYQKNVDGINAQDYNSLECVKKVFKTDLYFPKKGIIWKDVFYNSIKELMGISTTVINMSNCSSLPFDNYIEVVNSTESNYINLIQNKLLSKKISTLINEKSIAIFLNSELLAGSEAYGVFIAYMLMRAGQNVYVCVPKHNLYDKTSEKLDMFVNSLGLPPIVKLPYKPGLFNKSESDNENIAGLLQWVENNNIGMIIFSSLIYDAILLAEKADIKSFCCLFQPTGYDLNDIIKVNEVCNGVISDSEWGAGLYNKFADLDAIKIPSILFEQQFREVKPIKKDLINIAIGGTLQPRKRQMEAVIAFHKLILKGYNICLNIYGYQLGMVNDYILAIEDYINSNSLKERVKLNGIVEMEEIIEKNDIILSTSIDEGIPQTILISIAGGLLPVCFNSGGISEVIKDLETGFLIQEMDIDSISACIERAILNRDKWSNIIKSAQKILKEEYLVDKVQNKLLGYIVKKSHVRKCKHKVVIKNLGESNISNDICESSISSGIPESSKVVDCFEYENRILTSNEDICYVKQYCKKRRYRIRCDSNTISKIGIVFATEDYPLLGNVTIRLIANGRVIRTSKKAIIELAYHKWSFFEFKTIYNSGGQDFILEFLFEYTSEGRLGVFEVKANRRFIDRVFNKLRLPLAGYNTIYFKEM